MFPRKTLLAVGAAAVLLAGCATGPYYGGYGYDSYSYGGYGAYGPAYYDPYYAAPSIGLGYTYYDRDDRRRWREHRRDHDRDGRRDGHRDGVRDGHRDGRLQPPPATPYRGMTDHKGEPIGPGYQPPPGSDSPG